jgi:hypothetical protein
MFNIGAATSIAADAASGSRAGGSAVQAALQGVSFVVALSESSVYILRPTEFRGISRESSSYPTRSLAITSE